MVMITGTWLSYPGQTLSSGTGQTMPGNNNVKSGFGQAETTMPFLSELFSLFFSTLAGSKLEKAEIFKK